MQPKIISDSPASSDTLDSHDRIADAILSLVESTEGGKTIGLEGAWGSGKSSVIQILEKKIALRQNVFLYKFDAWTHQGEPLRRAFLEGLFDKILGTTWFQAGLIGDGVKTKWEAVRGELSRKIKMSTKKITPQLDFFGAVMLLTFLFFPVGISMLSSSVASERGTKLGIAIGSAILLIPIIFLAITSMYTAWKYRSSPDWKQEMMELLAKFTLKGHNTDETKTIENSDPTTIEFQSAFKEFMSDALSAPTKRLVIVVDNLDRISDKEVEAVWPILRSFVDNTEFSAEPWFKRFWVIIPFAPNSLKPTAETNIIQTEEISSPAKQTGFLDKVVQINFPVPTPILSNLKRFLNANLKAAFGNDLSEDTVHKIFVIISSEMEKEQDITPRLIISIINNMVATALQWPMISLVSHAYFSMLRRKSTAQDVGNNLSKGALNAEAYDSILPSTFALDLAVLTCNVEREVAAQRLYGGEIEKALIAGDGGLTLINNYMKVGYSEVLATLLSKNLSNTANDPVLQARKIVTLLSPELEANMLSAGHQHLIHETKTALRKMPWLPAWKSDFRKILSLLANHDRQSFFLDTIVSALQRTRAVLEASANSWHGQRGESPVTIVRFWKKIRQNPAVKKYLSERFSFETLAIPGSFDEWIRICGELDQAGELSYGFPPKITTVDIFRELSLMNHYSQPVARLISGCRSLEANSIEIPDEVIIAAFVNRINREAELPLNEALLTLKFVIEQAASRESVFKKLQNIDVSITFYYFGAIFRERPRRAKEQDMPGLNPEQPDSNIAPAVIANLIFLWVLQGVISGPDNLEPSLANGRAALKDCLIKHPYKDEIIAKLQELFALNDQWSSLIGQNILNSPSVDYVGRDFLSKL